MQNANSASESTPPSPLPLPPAGGEDKGEGGNFERIAHRGASGEAPENTIPAIRLAVQKYQVDRVEIDLRLTRDGVPVVIHDATLERTTDGKGKVRQSSLAELKRRDAGFWFDREGKKEFPYRAKGVTVPTLEEVLSEFPDTPFCLEIKDKELEVVKKVLEVIRPLQRKGPLLIGSFHGKIARELRRLSPPGIEGILSEEEVLQASLAFRLGFKKFSLSSRYAFLPPAKYGLRLDPPEWIDFLHRQGVSVFYWTINEVREMKDLLEKGGDGILTDYPDRFNQLQGPF